MLIPPDPIICIELSDPHGARHRADDEAGFRPRRPKPNRRVSTIEINGFQRPSAFGGSRAEPWPCSDLSGTALTNAVLTR